MEKEKCQVFESALEAMLCTAMEGNTAGFDAVMANLKRDLEKEEDPDQKSTKRERALREKFNEILRNPTKQKALRRRKDAAIRQFYNSCYYAITGKRLPKAGKMERRCSCSECPNSIKELGAPKLDKTSRGFCLEGNVLGYISSELQLSTSTSNSKKKVVTAFDDENFLTHGVLFSPLRSTLKAIIQTTSTIREQCTPNGLLDGKRYLEEVGRMALGIQGALHAFIQNSDQTTSNVDPAVSPSAQIATPSLNSSGVLPSATAESDKAVLIVLKQFGYRTESDFESLRSLFRAEENLPENFMTIYTE